MTAAKIARSAHPETAQMLLALGAVIRNLRHERGQTLANLAERAGLSIGHLDQIELGRTSPSLDALRRIAQGFGWTLADLIGRAESHQT